MTPLSNLSAATEIVDVTFQVRKGPLYFIRNIDVSGNTLTIDDVVRREVPIVEGQLYSQRAVMLARGRIERLGFFEEVDLRMEPTDDPEQLDMNVTVVERPTGSFSFGAGYSSQDGIVGTGALSQSNLFGRGYNTQFSADVGGQTQRFSLSLQDPYVFGSQFSLGGTLFRTDLRFEDFDQTQTGAEVVLGHALSEDARTRGLLRYSFASREIDESENVLAAGVILRELVAGAITSSLGGVSVFSDTRNDRLAPTEGYQLGGTLEYAGLGFFSQFARSRARATWYLGAPSWLLERSTFVVGTRFGWALPFNSIGDYDLPSVARIADGGRQHPSARSDRHEPEAAPLRAVLPGRSGRIPAARLRGPLGRAAARDPLPGQQAGQYLPVGRQPDASRARGRPGRRCPTTTTPMPSSSTRCADSPSYRRQRQRPVQRHRRPEDRRLRGPEGDRRGRRQQVHLLDLRVPLPDLGDDRAAGRGLLRHRQRLRGEREPVRRDRVALRYGGRGAVVLAVRTAGGGDRLPARSALGRGHACIRILRGGAGILTRTRVDTSISEGQAMQIHRAFVLLALGALLVWGTAAQDEPIKIGIVDIDQAISSTDEGKAAREEFARKQREAEQQMQPLMDRYKGVEEELKAKKFVLSEEALFQKQLDLAEMRNLIQNKIKELEGQLQVDQKRLEGPLTAKLVEIITDVGKTQGFTLILRRGTPGVLYTREALDVTDLIIKRYNQKG